MIPRRFWWPLLLSACSSSSLLASKGASGILLTPSAEARLKYYLKDAKIDEGETLHGFRSGSAITLALSGSQLADVMSHVGWSNKGTALYYMKLAEVLREGSPSDLLSSNELAASASTTLDWVWVRVSVAIMFNPPLRYLTSHMNSQAMCLPSVSTARS